MTEENRPPFLLEGKADIKHLNVRKEGPEDSRILMVDLKLSLEKIPARELCLHFEPHLLVFLWSDAMRDGKHGLFVRNPAIAPIGFLRELKGCTGAIAGLQFRGLDVKRIELQPLDGGLCSVTCSVTIHEPAADDVAVLAKRVQDTVKVRIEQQPDLFAVVAQAKQERERERDLQQAALELGLDVKTEKAALPTTVAVVRANGEEIPLGAAGWDLTKKAQQQLRDHPRDPLVVAAMDLVVSSRRASISSVQRHLKIGYNRAARLLEALELAGVVSPMDASGQREVLA